MKQRFYISMSVALLLVVLLYACKSPNELFSGDSINTNSIGFDVTKVRNDYDEATNNLASLKSNGKDKREKTNKRKLRWDESYSINTVNGEKLIVPFSLENEIFLPAQNGVYSSYGSSSFFIASKKGDKHEFEVATYIENQSTPSEKWSGQIIVENELGDFVKAIGVENGIIVSEGCLQDPNVRTSGYDCRLVEYFSCAYVPDIGYYAPCQYMYSAIVCYYIMPPSLSTNSNGYLMVVGGIQSSSGGGATNGNSPYYPFADRLTNLVRFNNLTANQRAEINEHWDDMLGKSCALSALYVALSSRNAKVDLWLDATLGPAYADAFYSPANKKIYFKSQSYMTEDILMEEFFHRFQDAYYPNGITQYETSSHVNIEFEFYLFKDILYYINQWPGSFSMSNADYVAWLDEITSGGTKFPTTWSTISAEYFDFLDDWDIMHPNVSGTATQNLLPGAMFEIFNSSGCPK